VTVVVRSAVDRWGREMQVMVAIAVAALVGIAIAKPSLGGLAFGSTIALGIAMVLFVLAFRRPRMAIAVLLSWLFVVGFSRRLASYSGFSTGTFDPLLAVGFTGAGFLVVAAARRGVMRDRTALGTSVLFFAAVSTVSLFNPRNGGVAGLALGLLYAVLPLCLFFVGRAFVTDAVVQRILAGLAWAGLAAALYGSFQLLVGLPSWDEAWAAQKLAEGVYSALNIGGVRPFAMFTAASEYSNVLVVATIAWVFAPQSRLRRLRVFVLPVMFYALAYQGSRTSVVVVVLALGLGLGLRLSRSVGLGIVVAGLAAIALFLLIGHATAPVNLATQQDAIEARTITGLQDPLDPRASTAQTHLVRAATGIRRAFTHPIGVGMAPVAVPTGRFSANAGVTGSEWDASNAALGAGLAGLVLFGRVIIETGRRSRRLLMRERSRRNIAVAAILAATFGSWLNSGHYFLVVVLWLLIGWVDHAASEEHDEIRTAPAFATA
jgi:hypothetical protein